MGMSITCDRCGVTDKNWGHAHWLTLHESGRGNSGPTEKHQSLCPQCRKEFDEFMAAKEKEREENAIAQRSPATQ